MCMAVGYLVGLSNSVLHVAVDMSRTQYKIGPWRIVFDKVRQNPWASEFCSSLLVIHEKYLRNVYNHRECIAIKKSCTWVETLTQGVSVTV
ncbi:hypothetical protein SCLCIDRAFT_1208218 [Scleroderma citrinum Foug A]|uniref:Uncharacterized protein n=1 Tax=Scleroderma citrinum Foug A TaxID=1036808 RepID=A0A0C3EAG7_9AGAM|nr:hypothetical protein SCLCIDRAFT_1208218 [Scleroderma citrinum Foug A]